MKLESINKIMQTAEPNTVNEYLAKGYKIIKIFSSKVSTESGEFVQPCYVLGLGREE